MIGTALPAVALSPDEDSVVIDLTRGATDPDGDPLRVASARITGRHPHGTVRKGGTLARTPGRTPAPGGALARAPFGAVTTADRSGPGTVTYRPEPSWRGTETIAYVLTDGQNTASGTVKVRTPNRRPVAADDARTLPYGSFGTPAVLDVLGNDTDPNHDVLTITSVSAVGGPLGGSAEVVDGGRAVRYTPGPTGPVPGTASFVYTVSDGHGGSASATASVDYAAAPPQPVTSAMSLSRHHTDEAYVGNHFAASGIPAGRSATFELTITGMTGWHGDYWTEGPAQCPERPAPVDGKVTVTCTVTGDGDFLHVDFDAGPGWTVAATLTARDFQDTTTGDDGYRAADPTPPADGTATAPPAARASPAPQGHRPATPTGDDRSLLDRIIDALPFG